MIEILTQYPKLSIILLGVIVSLFITVVQKYFSDQERMKELKKEQKELQERMKEHQKNGNHQKVMELQKEMFSQVGETFKHTLKPMLITFLPLIILFWFLRDIYNPILGGWWIAYYIGGSLVSSIIFRKIFKVA